MGKYRSLIQLHTAFCGVCSAGGCRSWLVGSACDLAVQSTVPSDIGAKCLIMSAFYDAIVRDQAK